MTSRSPEFLRSRDMRRSISSGSTILDSTHDQEMTDYDSSARHPGEPDPRTSLQNLLTIDPSPKARPIDREFTPAMTATPPPVGKTRWRTHVRGERRAKSEEEEEEEEEEHSPLKAIFIKTPEIDAHSFAPAGSGRKNAHSGTTSSIYGGNKMKNIKKEDGIPLWRTDIQYEFLRAVFENDEKVFTNINTKETGQTFADIYIDAMAQSTKTSKILRDKLLSERTSALNMAMVCLLVNVGRMNTTLNFFPEMRAQLRTYHAIPCLQAHQDPNASKQLQDAPRLKSILKGTCEDKQEPSTIEGLRSLGVPRTNPVNLIFVLNQYAPRLTELHFSLQLDFFDLVTRTSLSSKSRARGFLWLMWWYLESSFTVQDSLHNPFGSGQEPVVEGIPQKLPAFEHLSEAQREVENVDTIEEIEYGTRKQEERRRIIEADAATAFPPPKRGQKKALHTSDSPAGSPGIELSTFSIRALGTGDRSRSGRRGHNEHFVSPVHSPSSPTVYTRSPSPPGLHPTFDIHEGRASVHLGSTPASQLAEARASTSASFARSKRPHLFKAARDSSSTSSRPTPHVTRPPSNRTGKGRWPNSTKPNGHAAHHAAVALAASLAQQASLDPNGSSATAQRLILKTRLSHPSNSGASSRTDPMGSSSRQSNLHSTSRHSLPGARSRGRSTTTMTTTTLGQSGFGGGTSGASIRERKTRPLTAHQIAVERNRSERVDYLLSRRRMRIFARRERYRAHDGSLWRSLNRLSSLTDSSALEQSWHSEEDSDSRAMALDDRTASTASSWWRGVFRAKGMGGVVQRIGEEDDFGEEVSVYAGAVRRAGRRLERWDRDDERGLARGVIGTFKRGRKEKREERSEERAREASRRRLEIEDEYEDDDDDGDRERADGPRGRRLGRERGFSSVAGDATGENEHESGGVDELDDMDRELLGELDGKPDTNPKERTTARDEHASERKRLAKEMETDLAAVADETAVESETEHVQHAEELPEVQTGDEDEEEGDEDEDEDANGTARLHRRHTQDATRRVNGDGASSVIDIDDLTSDEDREKEAERDIGSEGEGEGEGEEMDVD